MMVTKKFNHEFTSSVTNFVGNQVDSVKL
jgi:hypothetical protein